MMYSAQGFHKGWLICIHANQLANCLPHINCYGWHGAPASFPLVLNPFPYRVYPVCVTWFISLFPTYDFYPFNYPLTFTWISFLFISPPVIVILPISLQILSSPFKYHVKQKGRTTLNQLESIADLNHFWSFWYKYVSIRFHHTDEEFVLKAIQFHTDWCNGHINQYELICCVCFSLLV